MCKLSRRQVRWALYLSRFDFQITHTPGKNAGKPDTLSRRPDHEEGNHDNEDCILLPDSLFVKQLTTEIVNTQFQQHIQDCQQLDDEVLTILQCLQAPKSGILQSLLKEEWSVRNGIVLKEGHIYVPKANNLKRSIISQHHDTLPVGHPGRFKMLEMVKQQYWWPKMRKFVFDYVDGCTICQSTKNLPNRPSVPLSPISPDDDATPFSRVSLDFITELPNSEGFDAILVVVDHDVTKATIIVPCKTTITVDQTVALYLNHVWKRFGLPHKIISDCGMQFTAHFTHALCHLLDINQNLSTAYHPQTDGQTEHLNQELEQFLCAFCNMRQSDWVSLLLFAEFAHNSHTHSTIERTPFEALMNFTPRSLPTQFNSPSTPFISKCLDFLSHIRSDLLAAQKIANQTWNSNSHPIPYQVGDQVWLEGKNLRTSFPSYKLAPRRHGPFVITSIIQGTSCKLELTPSWNIHPIFHAFLLSPYRETSAHGPNFTQPPPELIDGDAHYEVKQILDSHFFWNQLQYLVKWVGYPDSENLWLAASELSSAPDLVSSFHSSHPTAASPSVHPLPCSILKHCSS